MKNRYKIKQRKDDCHYETSIELLQSPYVTHVIMYLGYGITQEEADTKALEEFLKGIGRLSETVATAKE